MIEQKATDVYFDIEDAIIHDAYIGFKEDYLVLHSLIRRYKPETFFEVGTNIGEGLRVICRAMRKTQPPTYINKSGGVFEVISLDLPEELHHLTKQHPISEGKQSPVGAMCEFLYTQLRGDSMTFPFADYPCEGYFIDGEHDYEHPRHETAMVLNEQPKIIVWHDANIPEVWKAIYGTMNSYCIDFDRENGEKDYDLFRVTDTRVAYALRK